MDELSIMQFMDSIIQKHNKQFKSELKQFGIFVKKKGVKMSPYFSPLDAGVRLRCYIIMRNFNRKLFIFGDVILYINICLSVLGLIGVAGRFIEALVGKPGLFESKLAFGVEIFTIAILSILTFRSCYYMLNRKLIGLYIFNSVNVFYLFIFGFYHYHFYIALFSIIFISLPWVLCLNDFKRLESE